MRCLALRLLGEGQCSSAVVVVGGGVPPYLLASPLKWVVPHSVPFLASRERSQ